MRDEIKIRIARGAWDQRQPLAWVTGTNNLPGVQSYTAQEKRSVFKRDGNAGRGGLALLALLISGRGVL